MTQRDFDLELTRTAEQRQNAMIIEYAKQGYWQDALAQLENSHILGLAPDPGINLVSLKLNHSCVDVADLICRLLGRPSQLNFPGKILVNIQFV